MLQQPSHVQIRIVPHHGAEVVPIALPIAKARPVSLPEGLLHAPHGSIGAVLPDLIAVHHWKPVPVVRVRAALVAIVLSVGRRPVWITCEHADIIEETITMFR